MKSMPTLEVFFDAACPLCAREVSWIKTKDKDGSILFTDISSPMFDARTTGHGYVALMSRIHARMPNGRVIAGVEVFRQIYARLGFGRCVKLSRLTGISQLLEFAYEAFAARRLALTGRCEFRAPRKRQSASFDQRARIREAA